MGCSLALSITELKNPILPFPEWLSLLGSSSFFASSFWIISSSLASSSDKAKSLFLTFELIESASFLLIKPFSTSIFRTAVIRGIAAITEATSGPDIPNRDPRRAFLLVRIFRFNDTRLPPALSAKSFSSWEMNFLERWYLSSVMPAAFACSGVAYPHFIRSANPKRLIFNTSRKLLRMAIEAGLYLIKVFPPCFTATPTFRKNPLAFFRSALFVDFWTFRSAFRSARTFLRNSLSPKSPSPLKS